MNPHKDKPAAFKMGYNIGYEIGVVKGEKGANTPVREGPWYWNSEAKQQYVAGQQTGYREAITEKSRATLLVQGELFG